MSLRLVKERGDNAHHIVESTFKAFARGFRAAMDAVEGIDVYDSKTKSDEVRQSSIKRSTKLVFSQIFWTTLLTRIGTRSLSRSTIAWSSCRQALNS